jgi:hypothetical protein
MAGCCVVSAQLVQICSKKEWRNKEDKRINKMGSNLRLKTSKKRRMYNKSVSSPDSLTLLACVGSWQVKITDGKTIFQTAVLQDSKAHARVLPRAFLCDLWYTKCHCNSLLSKYCLHSSQDHSINTTFKIFYLFITDSYIILQPPYIWSFNLTVC